MDGIRAILVSTCIIVFSLRDTTIRDLYVIEAVVPTPQHSGLVVVTDSGSSNVQTIIHYNILVGLLIVCSGCAYCQYDGCPGDYDTKKER
jgi:hypothetical protein